MYYSYLTIYPMCLLFPFNGTMLSGCCIFYNYHFSVQFTFFKNILYMS